MSRHNEKDSANTETVEHDIVMMNIDGTMVEITEAEGESKRRERSDENDAP